MALQGILVPFVSQVGEVSPNCQNFSRQILDTGKSWNVQSVLAAESLFLIIFKEKILVCSTKIIPLWPTKIIPVCPAKIAKLVTLFNKWHGERQTFYVWRMNTNSRFNLSAGVEMYLCSSPKNYFKISNLSASVDQSLIKSDISSCEYCQWRSTFNLHLILNFVFWRIWDCKNS